MLENLCPECQEHLDKLKARLDALGISYEMDPHIVRGLDYYTKTVFEIISPDIGAQATVCGGGRYDVLIETLGGPKTPGIGFGMGLERLLMVLESLGIELEEAPRCDVYVAAMGERAHVAAATVTDQLRKAGLYALTDLCGRSFKAQFKYAGKMRARYVVTIGDNELDKGVVRVKNMDAGEENEMAMQEAVAMLTAGK